MSRIFTLLLILSSTVLFAQEFQEISTGTSYGMQSYVNLEIGSEHQVSNDAWDIGFTTSGFDAGVFINESAGSGAMPIALYDAQTTDFDAVPDTAIYLNNPLYNGKDNWSVGAFNTAADPENGLDFGWGNYNPQTHEVEGTRVFVVELRELGPKKIQIQGLASGEYTFRFADLDGANEVVRTVKKSDSPSDVMIYFSLLTAEPVSGIEPDEDFDLMYCRYTEYLDDPEGGEPIPYLLTGILSGEGVQIAQADNVNPADVEFDDYRDSLSSDLNVIGHDWKQFDLNSFSWQVTEDRAYFVQTAGDHLWKLNFIDFEGSSTGVAVFEKTDLGIVSSINDPASPYSSFDVYPNPASDHTNIAINAKEAKTNETQIALFDINGQQVMSRRLDVRQGLQVLTLNLENIPSGNYFVSLQSGQQIYTRKLSIIH